MKLNRCGSVRSDTKVPLTRLCPSLGTPASRLASQSSRVFYSRRIDFTWSKSVDLNCTWMELSNTSQRLNKKERWSWQAGRVVAPWIEQRWRSSCQTTTRTICYWPKTQPSAHQRLNFSAANSTTGRRRLTMSARPSLPNKSSEQRRVGSKRQTNKSNKNFHENHPK